jgi:hypothetical protein
MFQKSLPACSGSTLVMEAENPSEAMIHIYQTPWHYIPEDSSHQTWHRFVVNVAQIFFVFVFRLV